MAIPYVQFIDSSSLNRAVELALNVTMQEPRNLVINAGRGVVLRTKALTPFVALETIDTELGVISTPVLSTRGARKGLPLKSGRKNIDVPDQSLAMRIVLARLHPGSRYNQLTRGRWALDKATFSPGAGVAGFWAQVALVAKRMVSARHSSTHFLQAGWQAAYRKLTQLRYGGTPLVQDEVIDVEASVSNGVFDDLGATTLIGGGSNVSLVIENMVGMKGVNAESYNEALHKHGTEALQAGIAGQAAEMQARYLPRWNERLAKQWNAIP